MTVGNYVKLVATQTSFGKPDGVTEKTCDADLSKTVDDTALSGARRATDKRPFPRCYLRAKLVSNLRGERRSLIAISQPWLCRHCQPGHGRNDPSYAVGGWGNQCAGWLSIAKSKTLVLESLN